ncbi:MAG: hypothetical protein R2851_12305 [Caldilineaceae bacterium]
MPVAEAGAGERLVLGVCEDKNYRTIVAAAGPRSPGQLRARPWM